MLRFELALVMWLVKQFLGKYKKFKVSLWKMIKYLKEVLIMNFYKHIEYFHYSYLIFEFSLISSSKVVKVIIFLNNSCHTWQLLVSSSRYVSLFDKWSEFFVDWFYKLKYIMSSYALILFRVIIILILLFKIKHFYGCPDHRQPW